MFEVMQFPGSGQDSLFRQLQLFSLLFILSLLNMRTLCLFTMFFIFPMQLQLTFSVFLLKILRNLFDAGKCLSAKARNLRPTLVFTFRLCGELNHVIFLDLFRRWVALNFGSSSGRHSMLVLKPLFLSASLYVGGALVKVE